MKKRFPAIILALALCMGLAVPAFAADGANAYTFEVSMPNGRTAAQQTAAYQLRGFETPSSTQFAYSSAPVSSTVTAKAVPLWTNLIAKGLETVDTFLTEVVVLRAWSDPDGDGVYDARLFLRQGSDFSVVPLTEKGPFTSASGVLYTDYITHSQAGFQAWHDKGVTGTYPSFVPMSTDSLNALFGPNTLLSVSVCSLSNGKLGEPKATEWYLLTGKPFFSDVPASGQYYSAPVKWAVENGITTGATDTTFAPGKNCTQAQILTFLYRAAGEPASSAKAPVTVAAAYAPAVNWAYGKGMIGASFKPDAPCTRADAVKYIWQALGTPSGGSSSFSDVSAGADYAAAVNWAVSSGIVEGYTDGSFRPATVCNRGVIVTLLHRAYVPEERLTVQ